MAAIILTIYKTNAAVLSTKRPQSIHKIAPKNIVRDFESEYKNALKKETESFMIQSLILSYFIATSNICRMK